MRIGIDCREILDPNADQQAGVSHYVYFLLQAMMEVSESHELVLFFNERMRGHTQMFERTNIEHVFVSRSGRGPMRHWRFSRQIRDASCDVFHGPANSIPLGYNGPSVVTIHDLAIYAHPEWFPDGQWFSTRIIVPRSLRRADRIIAVSESTRKDLQQRFPLTKSKIEVIYEAPTSDHRVASEREWNAFVKQFGLSERFVLFVGTLEPRKNCVQLIAAFDHLLETHQGLRDVQLILAGAWGWKYDAIRSAMMHTEWGGRIKGVGRVSSEIKNALLARAQVFVYPSLYEGFGLPVLEAFAAGLPVITSNRSSLPEIAGKAAMLIDPDDAIALSRAMATLLCDSKKRSELSSKGKKRAEKFTWAASARETLRVYELVARKHRK